MGKQRRFIGSEGTIIPTEGAREWRMQPGKGGIRLTFRDPGDPTWTNAGMFSTPHQAVEQAK